MYGIDWSCEQQEVNGALVWVECNFHSNNANTTVYNFCIDVAYFNESDGKLVGHKPVCESIIAPNENKTGYAAFTHKDKSREKLNVCGDALERCVMLTQFCGPEFDRCL